MTDAERIQGILDVLRSLQEIVRELHIRISKVEANQVKEHQKGEAN